MVVVGPGQGRTRDAAGAHYLIKTLLVVITKLFNIAPCGYMTAAVHQPPTTHSHHIHLLVVIQFGMNGCCRVVGRTVESSLHTPLRRRNHKKRTKNVMGQTYVRFYMSDSVP